MSLWREVTHGFRSILSRHVADREIDEEVRQFMDEALAELIALGASPEDARRTVRLKYGTAHAAREEVRSFGWENTVASILSDLRYGTRLLRRNPGFTTIAVLTLGLGIGSATAIFSVVSPVLFEPLPYPHAERILTITDRSADGVAVPVAFGTFRELIERNHSFEALAVFKSWQPNLEQPMILTP